MKGKILIAVPTFENIKPQCFKSIYGLTNPKDFNLYFDYVKGYDCARARNEIAKLAIKHDFDYVLMIDSDVSAPKDALVKLLECETDIALGWYFKKRTKTVSFCLHHPVPLENIRSDQISCSVVSDSLRPHEL